MTRRLVIHIGDHKTGTTTIQHALATGGITPPASRILYPTAMDHNYLPAHFREYAASGGFLKHREKQPNLKAITAAIAEQHYDYAVLSGETFEKADPNVVAKVIDNLFRAHVDEVRILCYVRPHAERTLSGYTEQTKIGMFDGNLDDFHTRVIRHQRFQYRRRLREWRAAFGEEFILRPAIPKCLPGGSTLRDFVEQAFAPYLSTDDLVGSKKNESLTLKDLMLIKLFQRHLNDAPAEIKLHAGWILADSLAESSIPGQQTAKLKLHMALAQRIQSDYHEDAAAIDARYFGSGTLFQDALAQAVHEAVDRPISVEPLDHLSEDERRAIGVFSHLVHLALSKTGDNSWRAHLMGQRIKALQGN